MEITMCLVWKIFIIILIGKGTLMASVFSFKRSPQSSIGSPLPDDSLDCLRNLKPIGLMKSVFTDKNGTPRQPLVAETKGSLRNAKNVIRTLKEICLTHEQNNYRLIIISLNNGFIQTSFPQTSYFSKSPAILPSVK